MNDLDPTSAAPNFNELGPKDKYDRVVSAGIGRRWQRGGQDRVYIDNLERWYGLTTVDYGSGNVSSATLDGERISNSDARQIRMDLSFAKVWIDSRDGKFRAEASGRGGKIIAAIKNFLDRQPKPLDPVGA